jgi:RNA polymerase sigma-70 factor (ECF subfamily)
VRRFVPFIGSRLRPLDDIIFSMAIHRSNQEWLRHLGSSGESQSAAIEDLRNALLRAALYTFQGQLGHLAQFSQLEIQQLAEDCAQEALVSVLQHLPEFRGDSKFLTWAYKFAVNIGLTTARREQWKGMSLDDQEDFPVFSQRLLEEDPSRSDPELAAMRGEMWTVLRAIIQDELTEKQRLVLKWMVFEEVPMDVVVQHLGTNRNAVYKLLHEARVSLKRGLLAQGIDVGESIDLFGAHR